MGERLAGNRRYRAAGNSLATGAILVVLILIFGPVSGAHFNPAVSIAFALRRELPWRIAGFTSFARSPALSSAFGSHT